MNEFIGIDFGTVHCHTGIFRSAGYEVIPNDYDLNEIGFHLWLDEFYRKSNINIPTIIGLKQLFGSNHKDNENQKKIFDSVEKLFKNIFENIKKNLNSEVINGVLTVPCYYQDRERSALISIAERAGFNQIRLLDENVALALGLNLKQDSKNILIYSLGAGPFSCTLLKQEGKNFRTLNSEFSTVLSGTFFDSVILKNIFDTVSIQAQGLSTQNQGKLISMAIKAKEDLSKLKQTVVSIEYKKQNGNSIAQIPEKKNITITQIEFDENVKSFVEETIQLCISTINHAGLQKEDIDLIILAGGSTNIPIIRRTISDTFKSEIILTDADAFSRGAAIFASSLPLPPIKETKPLSPAPSKANEEIKTESQKKSNDYASEWVKKFSVELEEHHKLWKEEAYSESIEKMELVQERMNKFIANLCHSAGKKHLDKGSFKEAFPFFKKGYSYDRNDSFLLADLFSCYDFLIADAYKREEFQIAKKYLVEATEFKEAISKAPNYKNWHKLLAELRSITKKQMPVYNTSKKHKR